MLLQHQGLSARSPIRRAVLALVLLPALCGTAQAEAAFGEGDLNVLVRAGLRTDKPIVQAGKPIWVEFTLTNLTENRLTLRVPDLSSDPVDVSEMGLPVEHVFSGQGFGGPVLEDDHGEVRDSKVAIRPKGPVPAIKLAPFGSVGIRLDVTRYYPSMLRPGEYKLTWRPYNGSVVSEPLSITVLAERQAVILTDFGKMTIRFYYDKAPNHVQNFIELVEQRFYDNLTFNRLIPGGLIQGGDPLGNRRGIRADGKRLKAEFNDVPFEFGTVGMARSMQDPDSASCQFFICLGRQPGFDGQQTAFGYLVGNESFETLRRLAAVPTGTYNGLADYPKQPIYIRAISLESVPPRDRQSEPKPITPAASQPHPTILGEAKAPADTSAMAGGRPAADLPGLRAQGRVGRRPATAPE
ncbi:MAG TPA: peptidylprolyl isomerase [Phycisphaerae bacterium]|nr:peptidylprolyl isomerase [Phycisphaerae bacterium]HOM49843.1 peptidylprolyl isomerase [Phycisphaerae bacterium]HON68804.1 peptidylprolyl isomerase [Phycisphaerae bacterium]HPP25213.1 peptidylprolyl isomerase [Phycisphaerae bacterium]HPU24974.1 peptidylprolyl isomerase [Phycisphaerae bacterium]